MVHRSTMPTLRSRTISYAPTDGSAPPLESTNDPVSPVAALSLDPVIPASGREHSSGPLTSPGTPGLVPPTFVGYRTRKSVQRLFEFSEGGTKESGRQSYKRLKGDDGEGPSTKADIVTGSLKENVATVDKGKSKVVDTAVENITSMDKDKGKWKMEEVVPGSQDGYQLDSSANMPAHLVFGGHDLRRQAAHTSCAVRVTRISRNRGDSGNRERRYRVSEESPSRCELNALGSAQDIGNLSVLVQENAQGAGSRQSNRSGHGDTAQHAKRSESELDQNAAYLPQILQTNLPGVGFSGSNRSATANGEAAKARFLEIARRRAAHFAHFSGETDSPTVPAVDAALGVFADEQKRRAQELLAQVSAGVSRRESEAGEREEWPGPWSTAMRLVEGRAAAAAARLGSIPACEEETKPLVEWSPSRRADFRKNRIAVSLHDMCIEVLCANIQHVQSLVGVPDATRNKINARLCAQRGMSPTAFRLCFEASPGEVFIPDCTLATEEILREGMVQCSTQRLQVLELGMCGRGFSDSLCATFLASSANSMPNLTTLTVRGAYRLTDKGLITLLHAAPCLTVLDLTQCSMISEAAIEAVADTIGSTLNTLNLESCTQLDALKILPSLLKMSRLQKLFLSGVSGMSDGIVSELAVTLGSNLQGLSIADCRHLTDVAIGAVSICCPKLRLLDLGNVPMLTDVAIGKLADGCRSLKILRLNRGRFSDTAVAALVTASGQVFSELSLNSVRQVGDHTLVALSKHSKGTLEQLDVSWCRKMSDQALGLLADSCLALRELRLFGCTQVTDFFLEGHSNPKLTVIGLSEKPNVSSR